MAVRFGVSLVALAAVVSGKVVEVTTELPSSPVPYIVRNLEGPKILLADDIFRTLTNVDTTTTGSGNGSAGGFTMLRSNGKPNDAVPPHYHVHWHETFIPMSGTVRIWLNGKAKDLTAGDFAMVPGYNNHSYQFVAQETEHLGLIQPAGFDDFFTAISTPWSPTYNVPFPPDQGIAFNTSGFAAVVQQYDINQVNMTMGEPTQADADWHDVNGTLPGDHKTAYFLANGQGPHWWNEELGAVISPLATPVQTAGNFTISQISMRKSSINGTVSLPSWSSSDHQFLYGLSGSVRVYVAGSVVDLIQGDSLFVPAFTNFTLESVVNYNKFLLCAGGGNGVDSQAVAGGVKWAYSTPPAH